MGIVGVGGLGHFAVQFAKALGSDKVIVFSHSEKKREDAKKLGADQFVITENEEEMGKLTGEVDLIIVSPPSFPLFMAHLTNFNYGF